MKRFGVSVAVAAVFGLAGCASMECGTTNICVDKPTDKFSQSRFDACTAAKKKLMAQAKAGEARAQHLLSSCYIGGFGSFDESAMKESMKWLQAALAQDLMVAKSSYAYRLQKGTTGAQKDPDAARAWIDKALAQWRQSGGDFDRPFDPTLRYTDVSVRRWQKGETDFADFDRDSFSSTLTSLGIYAMMYGRKEQALADLCLARRFNPTNSVVEYNLGLIGKKLSDCHAD